MWCLISEYIAQSTYILIDSDSRRFIQPVDRLYVDYKVY